MTHDSACLHGGSCSLGNAAVDGMNHPRGGISAHRRTDADSAVFLLANLITRRSRKNSQFVSEGIAVEKRAVADTWPRCALAKARQSQGHPFGRADPKYPTPHIIMELDTLED